jgi:hypothetical protein
MQASTRGGSGAIDEHRRVVAIVGETTPIQSQGIYWYKLEDWYYCLLLSLHVCVQHVNSIGCIENGLLGQKNIQGVPGGKVNILGGHRIRHSKQKHVYVFFIFGMISKIKLFHSQFQSG